MDSFWESAQLASASTSQLVGQGGLSSWAANGSLSNPNTESKDRSDSVSRSRLDIAESILQGGPGSATAVGQSVRSAGLRPVSPLGATESLVHVSSADGQSDAIGVADTPKHTDIHQKN